MTIKSPTLYVSDNEEVRVPLVQVQVIVKPNALPIADVLDTQMMEQVRLKYGEFVVWWRRPGVINNVKEIFGDYTAFAAVKPMVL